MPKVLHPGSGIGVGAGVGAGCGERSHTFPQLSSSQVQQEHAAALHRDAVQPTPSGQPHWATASQLSADCESRASHEMAAA
jgi:hypothetical protein